MASGTLNNRKDLSKAELQTQPALETEKEKGELESLGTAQTSCGILSDQSNPSPGGVGTKAKDAWKLLVPGPLM